MIAQKNIELRRALKSSGLTYAELARLLKCSESKLYKLFRKDLSAQESTAILTVIKNHGRG